jgi:hypothetical protein
MLVFGREFTSISAIYFARWVIGLDKIRSILRAFEDALVACRDRWIRKSLDGWG